MSDNPQKVRYCGFENCKARMSAIAKDPHILCPSHVGWQCSSNQRCDICKDWEDSRMFEYMKLQEGKARKKVSKEKRRQQKSADGKSEHLMSPSSCSSSDMGEKVPCSVVDKSDRQKLDSSVDIRQKLDSSVDIRPSTSNITPSVVPPPNVSRISLGQSSEVPTEVLKLGSIGDVEPALREEAGEYPSRLGQPLQKLAMGKVGECHTPSSAGVSRRSRGSSVMFTSGMYSALRGVLDEHEKASRKEKMRVMFDHLMEIDPSLSESFVSGKSRRSRRDSGKTDRSRGSAVSYYKPTDKPYQSSDVEKTPGTSGSKMEEKIGLDKVGDKLELTKEWARMVQTGGVVLKSSVQCFYRDKDGSPRVVVPPTERSGGKLTRVQKLGQVALSAGLESTSLRNVSSGVGGTGSQPQGSEGVVSNVNQFYDQNKSIVLSPKESQALSPSAGEIVGSVRRSCPKPPSPPDRLSLLARLVRRHRGAGEGGRSTIEENFA